MKRCCCLLLAAILALGCTGCGWWDGAYVSVSPHQVGYDQSNRNLGVVTRYSELRSAVLALIDAGEPEGIITLSGYPEENVRADMEQVIYYAGDIYPVGAYAVSGIRYEYGQNLLSVEIDYRRSKTDIERIRSVRGVEGAKNAIAAALHAYEDSIILQITGYNDLDVSQYVADYSAENPNTVMEMPQVSSLVYPDTGTVRILEVQFTYQTSRESLRTMHTQVRQVFSSAKLYVTAGAEDTTKINQLYSFLMERFDYTVQKSLTPAYSLLFHGVGDSKAFAQVYAAMCRQSGLEAMVVSGTCDGESRFWNIIREGDIYYHVDLLECARLGYCRRLTDSEMDGYVWDYSAYPACGIPIKSAE